MSSWNASAAKHPLALALFAVSSQAGCAFEEDAGGPVLLVPEDIALHWDAAFDQQDDGRAALVPVDVMAYDGTTGEPLAFVDIEVESLAVDVGLVLSDAVIPLESWEIDGSDPAVFTWDIWRDRYFALEPADLWPVSAVRVQTDASGLARVFVFADGFERDENGAFAPAPIVVSMGATDDTFLLVPR